MRELADLARDEARRAEEACRATDELASSVETSVRDVNGKLDGIRDSCEELLKAVGTAEEASARRDAEFSRRLDELEGVLGRIDRNTQKGFGKERAKHAAW